MALSLSTILAMERHGLIGRGRRLLDLGSSNFYDGCSQDVMAFVRRHNPEPRTDLEAWAERFAAGGGRDAAGTPLNQSFAGELFEAAGMGYAAIDIADGYGTTLLDLNSQTLPATMASAFDSVVNCGTSEHIMNQQNTFRAVHEACRRGGLMMHIVPSVGWLNHGYFCYTPRFFFDLAAYNHYEVADCWFEGDASENVFAAARQYMAVFANLADRLDEGRCTASDRRMHQLAVPTISLLIVLKKTRDTSFVGAIDMSTSVGEVRQAVVDTYVAHVRPTTPIAAPYLPIRAWRWVRRRLS